MERKDVLVLVTGFSFHRFANELQGISKVDLVSMRKRSVVNHGSHNPQSAPSLADLT